MVVGGWDISFKIEDMSLREIREKWKSKQNLETSKIVSTEERNYKK